MYENAFRAVEQALRAEEGIANELDYVEQTSWVQYLKCLDDLEVERQHRAELDGESYTSIIADEDQLRAAWGDPDNRSHFLKQLSDQGYDQDCLEGLRHLVDAPKSDLFDVLAYVLFSYQPKTRTERAKGVRDEGMSDFDGALKQLLLGILSAYEEGGEDELATKQLGRFLVAKYGSASESQPVLGDLPDIRAAHFEMQGRLYAD